MSPRVVIGLPLYDNERHLQEALESLLLQTYSDVAFVVVDDGRSDATRDLVARYAELDDRISYHRNPQRLGMVGNWRRCFELARERHPGFELFAWGSDHDVWHPRWLEELVAAMDGRPHVVLAYPLTLGVDDEGNVTRLPWRFSSLGLFDGRRRLRHVIDGMAAGSMVYGLFRADVLERCGVFRHVLLPDRLLLAELSMHGQFAQVQRPLWRRRYQEGVAASYERQRRSFWPEGAPWWAHLPWWAMHAVAVFWSLVVRGQVPGDAGRRHGARLAGRHAALAVRYEAARTWRRQAKRRRRWRKRMRKRLARRLRREVRRHPRAAAAARVTIRLVRSPRRGLAA